MEKIKTTRSNNRKIIGNLERAAKAVEAEKCSLYFRNRLKQLQKYIEEMNE